MKQTFSKQERLCRQSLIDELFVSGERLMAFPYSVRFMILPADRLPMPAQVLIGVSKRRFRHAVDRNRAKRLMRECYRRRKEQIYRPLSAQGLSMAIAISYVGNQIMDYDVLGRKMDKLMQLLEERVARQSTPTAMEP